VALGAASTFAAAGGAGIVNTGTLTQITGDAGAPSPSATITGLHDSTGVVYSEVPGTNVGAVSGTIFTADSASNTADQANLMGNSVGAAMSDLTSRDQATDPTNGTGELGALTLAPGLYLTQNCQVTTGDLTLDAQGDPNAVWVFQCSVSGPTVGDTTAPRSVTLINSAQAKNVYWASFGAATINAVGGGTMVGTIISSTGSSVGSATSATATNVNGRVFDLNNPVALHNAVIAVPAQ